MTENTLVLKITEFDILRDVVKDYPGIVGSAESLINDLNNPEIKLADVLKNMRNYALKNFYLYNQHEKGPKVTETIMNFFFNALSSPDISIHYSAIENILVYLEKILMDTTTGLDRYSSVLSECFLKLLELPDEFFIIIIENQHQLKKHGQILLEKIHNQIDLNIFNKLLKRFFKETYSYWLKQKDPLLWLKENNYFQLPEDKHEKIEEIFYPISHSNLTELLNELNSIDNIEHEIIRLKELVKFPGFIQIARFYEEIGAKLSLTGDVIRDLNIKILYLLMIMDTHGLSSIHENTLREINRTISNIVRLGEPDQIKEALSEIFQVFQQSFKKYPETALYCIQITGNALYGKGISSLVEWYLQKIVSLGFQYPDIKGVSDEWQVKANRAHLKNIRVWLELIENNPKWSKQLISGLIINLSLGGVHISDTDIFQKDITKLLNSDIKPVYHLIKQLSKLFPVYFSEIGAEGPLREVSTEIDEITHRNDKLVHFLRKQSHVDSSARVVDFIEAVIHFWLTKDKTNLKDFLYEELYNRLESSGEYYDELHIIFKKIFSGKGIKYISDLLYLTEDEIILLTDNIQEVSDREKRRAYLAIKFYQLLHKKYRFDIKDIKEQLIYAHSLGLPATDSLISILDEGNIAQRLEAVLNYLEKLKEIILSPEKYEPVENIFRKRHIAAGMPSMYGKYHERKFDALSMSYRLENLANILFEDLLHSINLKFITRATLFKIQKYATLFFKALQIDGISSNRFENNLELLTVALEVRRFSFSQYIDIFRGFSEAVQDILNTYYSSVYKNNLKQIILNIGTEHILSKYLHTEKSVSDSEFINKISEQFLREIVASSFGLQQLDSFISRILKTLFEQAEGLDIQTLDLLMSYDPKKALSGIHIPNQVTFDRIHLGNKGHNLVKLASLKIPVPPGFIITTEVFRCEKAISRFRYVREHLEEGIKKHLSVLEKQTGKSFGDPDNPLVVSVRSGSAISMPGMMISFLNVGLNEEIVEGLIKRTSKPWFAWDCYRRFMQCWGMSYGMERDKFDALMNLQKSRYHVLKKIQFSPEQMKELALSYRKAVEENGIHIYDEPMKQLFVAIEQVFKSWSSKKAQAFREIMGISENWGTAVIVQAMVYGNLDTNSGTGVLFTRNPLETGDRVVLWGDYATGAQGEDIVSGLVTTLPISNEQKPSEERITEVSFEEKFPENYNALLKIAKDLIYNERWSAQEIEFTFEGSSPENLFILQTRDMAITRRETFMAFEPSEELTSSYLSRGIGVGGGALSGRVVFDLDEIQEFRKNEPDTPLILIRSDTVPDDIRHISAADGILTARGGSTSHASIIANRLGKTCVVGCNNLIVLEQEKKCILNKKIINAGDFLSIDGRNGAVYEGVHNTKEIRAEIPGKV
jgi:pyruvate,orthophosphate dikinase